ncbi:MAG: hypothetical protein OHK006_01540 [Thermodesulfovibrionales bacterium]
MSDSILFVTKGGEQCDEGFSYVLELAKNLNSAIEVLIMKPAQLAEDFEDIMVAATFAEAGDVRTMREVMDAEQCRCRELLEAKIASLTSLSRDNSVSLLFHTAEGDVAAAIKTLLRSRRTVDMILLSPSLSQGRKPVDVRKLIKTVSKPIVHISRPLASEI